MATATYKIKRKTATNGSTEEILLPISSIDGLQTALNDKQKVGDYATTTQVNAKYTKPSGGIPKSDLVSAVQTSLGKADTAVQTESDPTVPAWAKASSKPTYTASEVKALPIGGGTITGTSGDTPLYIKSAHTTASYEGFQSADGTTLGYFGYSSKDNPTVYLSGGAKTIYHAGNFPSATASALGGIKISFSNGVLTITT